MSLTLIPYIKLVTKISREANFIFLLDRCIQEVIIYGGCGQLGRAVLNRFKESGYKTISIDRVSNDNADQESLIIKN